MWVNYIFLAVLMLITECTMIQESKRVENEDKREILTKAHLLNMNTMQKNFIMKNHADLIEQILISKREGRRQREFDEFYEDEQIEKALQGGNETKARNLITEKLCNLGLMNCNIDDKQFIYSRTHAGPYNVPFYRNGTPIGKPYLANSLYYKDTQYESFLTPNPYPSNMGFHHSGAFVENTAPILTVNLNKVPSDPVIYGTKAEIPNNINNNSFQYNLEETSKTVFTTNNNKRDSIYTTKTSNSANLDRGSISTLGTHQHVHHHYHHVSGIEDVANFPKKTHAHIEDENINTGYKTSKSASQLQLNSFNTPAYQTKEEYNLFLSTNMDNQMSYNGNEKYSNLKSLSNAKEHNFPLDINSYDSSRHFLECYCVPFAHCLETDRVSRKENIILPIDPRNINKNIEALADDAKKNMSADILQENKNRSQRSIKDDKLRNMNDVPLVQERAYQGDNFETDCRIGEVCCRQPVRAISQHKISQCGLRNAAGITGRIKNTMQIDGDSEFGEYPWHVAILRKDPTESIYVCGGTLISNQFVLTAAHCIKSQNGFALRARLGEWDVNHDVEFFPYIERDIVSVQIHPEYYAGTLDNDLAALKLEKPIDFNRNPHISPACLPEKSFDFTGQRCWTTGWGKDSFGDHGKYQNILKEVDVPILSHYVCEQQLRQTRLGYTYKLHPGFICAGGEEGKDACKGDGGGPLVCEQKGIWYVVGIVSWGIGCGQANVPGIYVRVSHYADWIYQITKYYI